MEEELMREIIESLKSFTIIVATILVCLYLIIAGLAVYAIVSEKKKHKKNSAGKQPAENEDNHTTQ